jgi:uncharacterized spore protein YtfJ
VKEAENLFESVVPRLEALVKSNAVLGPITTVGSRHAVPLVELSLGLGGGGGGGEGDDPATKVHSGGQAAGAAGGARVTPVAVLIVDGATVSIHPLGH